MDFDKFKKAADSIKMPNDMKNRIRENCIYGKKKTGKRFTPKKIIAFACAFVVIFSISIGLPIINSGSNPIGSKTQTSTKKASDNSVFGIKAYAASNGEDVIGKEAKLNEKVNLNYDGFNNLSDMYFFNEDSVETFLRLHFQLIGENIDSITFKTDGYFYKQEETTFGGTKYEIEESKESTNGTYLGDQSKQYWGYNRIGNEYTVAYEDQMNINCMYALAIIADQNEYKGDYYVLLHSEPHKIVEACVSKLNKTILTMSVKFKDGSQKDYYLHFIVKDSWEKKITMYMTDK